MVLKACDSALIIKLEDYVTQILCDANGGWDYGS